MFMNIRRLLCIDSLEEQVSKYEINLQRRDELQKSVDSLADEFTGELSIYKKRKTNVENEAIAKKIDDKWSSFLNDGEDSYKKRLSAVKKELNKIEKSVKSFSKDEKIQKAVSEKKQFDLFKKAYKTNVIKRDDFFKAMKKVSKKVRYADTIVLNEEGKMLIIKRSQWEDIHSGAWVIPGGHVDMGETFKEGAVRELKEETGLTAIEPEKILEYSDKNVEIEYYITYINTNLQTTCLQWEESSDFMWIDPYKELDKFDFIFDMKKNIKEALNISEKPNYIVIRKAIDLGLIKLEDVAQVLEKAKSGTYTDTAENRKLKRVGAKYGTAGKPEVPAQKNDKKPEDQPKEKTNLNEDAKNASVSQLEAAVKESPKAEVRQAAHQELDRRTKEEHIRPEEEKKFGEPKKEEEPKQAEGGKKEAKNTGDQPKEKKDILKLEPKNIEELREYGQFLADQSKEAYRLQLSVESKYGGAIRKKEAKEEYADLLKEKGILSKEELKKARLKLIEFENKLLA
jgi:mutator protein MutT